MGCPLSVAIDGSMVAIHWRSTPVAELVAAYWRPSGNVSPWSVELASASWASTSWSPKKTKPFTWLTSASVSPPPPVVHIGRERGEHVGSKRSRKLSPASVERDSWPMFDRDERGQSTKIRLASRAPGADHG